MEIPVGFGQVNFHFTGSAVPSGAQMTLGIDIAAIAVAPSALATMVAANWATADIPGLQSNTISCTEVSVKYGPTETGPSGTTATVMPGESAQPAVPPNTSLLVQKVTAFGGRAGKGRWYLPGIPEVHVDQSGVLSSGYLTTVNTAFDAFLTAMEADDIGCVVLHGAGSPLSLPSPILSFEPQTVVATQRRRLRR